MNSFSIKEFDFNNNLKNTLSVDKKAKDWPVVYVIHNDKELYVGETQNAVIRMQQHLANKERQKLKQVKIIFDNDYNKSAILDIEQSLIQLFSADKKYKLQNHNGGQSEKHNYYQREKYLNKVDDIWNAFMKKGLATNSSYDLRNTDLFKYSPYNTLTAEQNDVCRRILSDAIACLSQNKKGVSIIRGGAGTGKTIVLINMIYKLVNAGKIDIDFAQEEVDLSDNLQLIHDIKEFTNNNKSELKIGYVVPMTSIRKTLKTVFKDTGNGLKANMVIGPFDVFNDDYDIVFVDEAHRLSHYKNIGYRGPFKKCAEALGRKAEEVTQLDMVLEKSKYCVLVYDENQTVKGSDITKDEFKKSIIGKYFSEYTLTTQMRCKGGELYTDYIESIFNCSQNGKLDVENYEFCLYEDVEQMIFDIKELDKEYKLCRNAAGYSWEWISKGIGDYKEVIRQGKEDIEIQGHKYVWNMTNEEFILSDNAINEIGCIHTLQGYDLNYAGIILGNEIYYDKSTNRIEVDLDQFYDKYVKQGSDYETVRDYIINSYKVMMSRGIKGTFIYVCNDSLREYLKRFVDVKKK